jgi:hypothetical protein
MNLDAIRPVVEAVLYEGYILYPYRPSSAKNRQRWTFGGIYPQAYFDATAGAEPWQMQTQCLIEGDRDTRIEVRVRFLHPIARDVGELESSLRIWPEDHTPAFKRVPSLMVNDTRYLSWQEAMERDVLIAEKRLGDLLDTLESTSFAFTGHCEIKPIQSDGGLIEGVLVFTQTDVCGVIDLGIETVRAGVHRLTVRIRNLSMIDPPGVADRNQASLYSFASTHTLLGVRDGAFISLIDPPASLRDDAAACENQGTYPVLIGTSGDRNTLLSSPIILYDYPEVAPESPGDLFDSAEIDEILSLRILTMTDAEKREMVVNDPRAAGLLARTEALDRDDFMRLHGVMRHPQLPDRIRLQVGDHVRLRPKPGKDIMDLVLAGMTALIEAVEYDFDDRVHVAVVIDEDPGREWGVQRMPGHRFFFSPDEIELLQPGQYGQARS